MTVTPGDGSPERPTSWWDALIRMVGPAFYGSSWAPWLRLMISAVVIFGAYMVVRLTS
jgi:hypothetical protein